MRFKLIACALALAACNDTFAQQFDPRIPLGQLIQAFQNCVASPVYRMMGPQLYQTVWAQTGGSGCYLAIRSAGPVQSMQVIEQQAFPNGTVYAIRVVHANALPVDWFIGINRFTGTVDYLNFQTAQQALPSVSTGPVNGGAIPMPAGSGTTSGGSTPAGGDGGNPPSAQPPPKKPAGKGDGCDLFPSMC
jgi:hypothetical protein